MRRIISLAAAAAFMAAVAVPAFSATAPAKPAAKPAVKKVEVKCPVMGNVVTDTKTAPKSVYKGKTYYFCCPMCKPKFDKSPEKYIKSPTPKK